MGVGLALRGWELERAQALAALALATALAALVLLVGSSPPSATTGAPAPDLDQAYGQLPISFAPAAPGSTSDFTATTDSGSIALRSSGAEIVPGAKSAAPISVSVAGAAAVQPAPLAKLPGVVNDLRGNDRSAWRRNVPTYARVRYADVLPGIAMDWHGTSGTLEYDFRVAPGADPSSIGVDYGGAPLHLTGGGALIVGRGAGAIRQAPPVAYQPIGGERVPVDAAFTLDGQRVGFGLGAYDSAEPLVIDPLVLTYSTLLGGGAEYDYVRDVAIDSSGSAYLTGETGAYSGSETPPFPVTGGAFDTTRSGNFDAFVTKLNPTGTAVVYSTLLGGDGVERGDGVAVDGSGNAYVTGWTDSRNGFPTAGGGFTTATADGYRDVFVTKLNPTGSGLVYSARFGGARGFEEARAIALDSTGAAWITGYTGSEPASQSCMDCTAYPTAGGGSGDPGDRYQNDMFVTKLTPAGTTLAFSTYLGGSSQDEGNDIDVDSSGRAYIAGFTSSYDDAGSGKITMPFVNAYEGKTVGNNASNSDAYVARFSSTGTLQYASAIGGAAGDFAYGIAADDSGHAYIGGATSTGATNFDLKGEYEGPSGYCCYGQDAFLAKFDTNASGAASLVYSTNLGGGGTEGINAVEVDSTGAAYVGGTTGSGVSASPTYDHNAYDFDVTADRLASNSGGSAFVTKFTPAGNALAWSTTIPNGSSSPVHTITSLAVDEANGAVYYGGYADGNSASSYPTTPGAFQTTPPGGQWDGFAGKLTMSSGPIDTTPPDTAITSGPGSSTTDTTPTFGFSSTEAGSTFQCRFDSAAFAACPNPFTPTSALSPGPHTFEVRAIDPSNNVDPSPASQTFTVTTTPTDTTPPETTISSGPATGSSTTDTTPTFAFTSNEAGSSFQCRYDAAAFAACSSPYTRPAALPLGSHTFQVKATDPSGNVDPTPASRTFTVAAPPDTTPPQTTITKAPQSPIKSKKLPVDVSFGFSSSEAGSTFTCKLDKGAAKPCSSPQSYELGKGKHTFTVIARDAAGNADATPATAKVTVKKKKRKKKKGKH